MMRGKIEQILRDAIARHQRNDIAGAVKGYQQVLAADAKNADALHLFGVIRADQGDLVGGAEMIHQALVIRPQWGDALYHLGNIYLRGGVFVEAEKHFRQAAALLPRHAMVRNNLGGVLLQLQRYDEASVFLAEALKIDPTLATALTNYALSCEISGRYDDVLPAYDRVLAADPNNISAHYYRAMTLLSRGRLAEGWAEYIWRWKRAEGVAFHGRFSLPYWQGEELNGGRLLVWLEQGPGDELLISSMLPDLIARGIDIVLLCSTRLAPLLKRSFPDVVVVAADDHADDVIRDARCIAQASFTELGHALRPTFEAFPSHAGYLKDDVARTAALRRRYLETAVHSRLVGISWRSKNVGLEHEKTLPLEAWAPILATPGIQFVSLQYGADAAECAELSHRLGVPLLYDPSINPLNDLDGFTSQVAAMDLVVSVSNTTVHVAGALGRPTWVMLPAARGRLWCWFLSRSDSPWYPSVRLFRQQSAGDWAVPIASVAEALRTWSNAELGNGQK